MAVVELLTGLNTVLVIVIIIVLVIVLLRMYNEYNKFASQISSLETKFDSLLQAINIENASEYKHELQQNKKIDDIKASSQPEVWPEWN